MKQTLRVPWAGPLVALALIVAAVPQPLRAEAAPATVAAASSAVPLCQNEAYEFGEAALEYVRAWDDYINSLPGGTESEILGAAERLNAATDRLERATIKLLICFTLSLL